MTNGTYDYALGDLSSRVTSLETHLSIQDKKLDTLLERSYNLEGLKKFFVIGSTSLIAAGTLAQIIVYLWVHFK
jgi:hypothetical protein